MRDGIYYGVLYHPSPAGLQRNHKASGYSQTSNHKASGYLHTCRVPSLSARASVPFHPVTSSPLAASHSRRSARHQKAVGALADELHSASSCEQHS